MKKCINYWTFPGGLEGKVKVSDAIKMAKKYGYEGIELCFDERGEVSPETTQEQAAAMLAEAAKNGIEITSLATGLYGGAKFGSSAQADRDKAVKLTEKYLELASWLKVDSILVVPGAVDVFFNPAAEVFSGKARHVVVRYDQVRFAVTDVVVGILTVKNRHHLVALLCQHTCQDSTGWLFLMK